jgi:uncharacterized hydrophobic protein (TIGR00271 family)
MTDADTNALEEVAGEKLGVQQWDRPAIFRDAADSATDNQLPYWLVLVLSGGIATLGLAINSSAVVIGAMLVAPLLAPVVGLALALAVGDGRLAVQTGAIVIASTVAVVVIGALLTVLLPFQAITLEISARTRPTTLDLVIAVFSGLVGVLVTVARGSRLSAAIPGVAISVALIPPLAVAGFGIGAGWNVELIYGSMLLYGANLAGIVLSGMLVFLLVGMHRSDVVQAARKWHANENPHGLAALAARAPLVRSMGVFRSPWSRVGLVTIFVVALGVPLSESLGQIARETRVERAVGEAAQDLFDVRERASIVSRQVVYGTGGIHVYLRVATTDWFDADAREDFERRASAGAGEPVRLSLEQLPAGEDLSQLASLIPREEQRAIPGTAVSTNLEDVLASARLRLRSIGESVTPPSGVEIVGLDLTVAESGRAMIRVTYAADARMQSQAEEMLQRQLGRLPELQGVRVALDHLSTQPIALLGTADDSTAIGEIARRVEPHERLSVEIVVPDTGTTSTATAESVRRRLEEHGLAADRVRVRNGTGAGAALRVAARPVAPE